jgi:hypothetical protein
VAEDRKLKIEFPSAGWRQFLTSRKEMLDEFDRAHEQSRGHEVETYHGTVAEAEIRRWLGTFLPKKYAVTPGYIVSPGIKGSEKLPHFDVIIYNALESPILWVEGSADRSEQGRSLAIPVEYVSCVLEVKARLTSSTITSALEHLTDLKPLMDGYDDDNDKYKLHLPQNFFCGLVFFELQKEDEYSLAIMEHLIDGIYLRRFFGGAVLRGQGFDQPETGKLSLGLSVTPFEGTIGRDKLSLLSPSNMGFGKSRQFSDQQHILPMLGWSRSGFSQFGFDIVSLLQGTYQMGQLSSFYGMVG